jgi:hypothetical protein
MTGALAKCRSVRAVGQRYRIIYRVRDDLVEVTVLTVGIRKEGDKANVYDVAERLRRKGVLEPLVVPIEEVHVFPKRANPVSGKITCPHCKQGQTLEISKEQLRAGYSFPCKCEVCKKDFTSKLRQADYDACVEKVFGGSAE